MSNAVDWDDLAEKTVVKESEAKKIISDWLKKYPNWQGWIAFSNYPPVLFGTVEILQVNDLSDARMAEVGELSTEICNKLSLTGKVYKPRKSNQVQFKFWIPMKKRDA